MKMAIVILKAIEAHGPEAPVVMVRRDAVQIERDFEDEDGFPVVVERLYNDAVNALREVKDVRIKDGRMYRLLYVEPQPLSPPAPLPALEKPPAQSESPERQATIQAALRATRLWREFREDYRLLYCSECDNGTPLPEATESCPICGALRDDCSGVMNFDVWRDRKIQAAADVVEAA
jgi:hypothetical protein